MTTHDQTIEEEQPLATNLTGDLAESARRHLAYLALAQQIATSENALQQLLEVIERRRAAARQAAPEEKRMETIAGLESLLPLVKRLGDGHQRENHDEDAPNNTRR